MVIMKGCNKMKKYLLLLISVSLCLSAFSGCNSAKNSENEPVSAEVTSESDEITVAETENLNEITEAEIQTEIPDDSTENTEYISSDSPESGIVSNEETSAEADSSAESIILSQNTLTVLVDETAAVEATITPSGSSASLIWSSTDSTIASVDSDGNIKGISEGACTVMVKNSENPDISDSIHVTVKMKAETTGSNSTNGVTSLTYISGILIVNKTYALPSDYAPDVDADAMAAFEEMQKAAYAEGYNLYISSGYRSYSTQESIYNNYVARDGQQMADTYSARPGHSEHQTGLAFDLNSVDASFANTPEGKWVAENCYKYGFIIRYPQSKSAITGYMYEPWHIRYLGTNIATSVYQSGLCLEEYLGITSFYEDDTQY